MNNAEIVPKNNTKTFHEKGLAERSEAYYASNKDKNNSFEEYLPEQYLKVA